jgi:hypothetical protein
MDASIYAKFEEKFSDYDFNDLVYTLWNSPKGNIFALSYLADYIKHRFGISKRKLYYAMKKQGAELWQCSFLC